MSTDKQKARRRELYERNKKDPVWLARARAKNLAYAKRRYHTDPKHRAKVLADSKVRYERDPEKHRAQKRLQTYGVTAARFQALLAHQGGCCAICLTPDPGAGRNWHVDHCHETGVVRGLLCTHCNLGLGHFKDNRVSLANAAKYLLRAEVFK